VGRPRAYETDAVVEAARDLFWQRGYDMTSIGALEHHTGLDRSSLYHAFGSKDALFDAALRSYLKEAIETRLRGMRQPGSGLDSVVAFFKGMGQTFRENPELAARGCLMVNTIGELGMSNPHFALAVAYRDSFRESFHTALSQAARRKELHGKRVHARAKFLASTTMGLFLTARIEPTDAAGVCDAVAAEVASWRLR
jgi:TetR/AcrR family transcriptional regulator, transcriptional repressor for nem operon